MLRSGALAVLVGALLLNYPARAAEDFLNEPLACSKPGATSQLICRIHHEALWLVLTHLSDIAKKQAGKLPVVPRDTVEHHITIMTEALEAAGVVVPDLQREYRREVIQSALDAVPTILSAANYGFLGWNDPAKKASDSDSAIARNAGICGNDAALFAEILTGLGIRNRPVQFWWRDENNIALNHIAIEAFWNGQWRLYDPTFGAYFVAPAQDDMGPLSTGEARANGFRAIADTQGTTYRLYSLRGDDPFEYLRRKDVDVTTNGQGVVTIHLDVQEKELFTAFRDIPNFVGDNIEDGVSSAGTSFRFATPLTGNYTATVDIAASAGCVNSVLKIGDRVIPIRPGSQTISDIEDPHFLRVEGPDDVCYAVLNSLQFAPTP